MAAVPLWLRGRDVTAINAVPQTVDAAGTLSDGTSKTLLGQIDEVTLENTQESEEISPLDTTRANQVIIKDQTTITLVEIIKKRNPLSGAVVTPTSFLADLVAAGDYFKIVLGRGGSTTTTATWTFYGLRGRYSEQIRRGKSTATLDLVMLDPGSTNPAYVP